MKILLIAEKPSVARKLAYAIGNGSAKTKKGSGRTSYFEMDVNENKVVIASAAGHIFTIRDPNAKKGYPVLDVEWAPSYLVNKGAEFTKDYLETLKIAGSNCDLFINACDFDLEGTVIGTNIIKYLNDGKIVENSKRMKFSTTTVKDLLDAFNNLLDLDLNNFYAGEARHMIDWMWGINFSRALTRAITEKLKQGRVVLSIGRVQGPSLSLLAKREKEIVSFVPEPYWKLLVSIKGIEFNNLKGNMKDKLEAEKALNETNKYLDSGEICEVEKKEETLYSYPPFDLTSLQIEASRTLRLDPSRTLQIAQSLYERSYISYPRTSSQKLPFSLNLKGIITNLSENPKYLDVAKEILEKGKFIPRQGSKNDQAHPAIHPTGIIPKTMNDYEEKLYDLIVMRFLACFAEPALAESTKITAKFGLEEYLASARKIKFRGWIDVYKYAKVEDKELPEFNKGEKVKADSINMKELMTEPLRRYTKTSIISELEKKNLGTKATRATIVDILFRRGYIDGRSIQVTELGMTVYEALKNNCEMIVDENTTAKLESDMEKVSLGEKSEKEVIDEGKEMLIVALKQFDENIDKIGEEMKSSFEIKREIIGKCNLDGGELVAIRSRFGKRFAGCSNYPNCKNTYPLPQFGKIIPTGKVCEVCGAPIIKIAIRGAAFESDINMNCPLKKKKAEEKAKEKEKKAKKIKAAKSKTAKKTKSKKVKTKASEKPKRSKKIKTE